MSLARDCFGSVNMKRVDINGLGACMVSTHAGTK